MGARTLLSSLLLLVGGCVIVLDNPEPSDPGGDPKPTPPPATRTQAQQAFDRDVYPILMADCASCHAGEPMMPGGGLGFIAPGDPEKTYELVRASGFLTSDPDSSRLLTK